MKKSLLTTVAVAVAIGFIVSMMIMGSTMEHAKATVEPMRAEKTIDEVDSYDIDAEQYMSAAANVDGFFTEYEDMMEQYLTDTNPEYTDFDVEVTTSTVDDYDLCVIVSARDSETGEPIVEECFQTLYDVEQTIEGINNYYVNWTM